MTDNQFVVYVLRTSKNTLYCGYTIDLQKRLETHRSKCKKSSKYLKYFDSFELVYSEMVTSKSDALKREAAIKKLTRIQKEDLIKKMSSKERR